MRKNLVRAGIVLGLSGIMTFNTFALTFKDVSTSHWAYTGIEYMTGKNPANKKYMAPNNAGEFKPNEQMTLFEVVDLLARVWGYEDIKVNPNMDKQLAEKIAKNYAAKKPIIDQYSAKYKDAWNHSINEEIAYLLGHGFLLESELDQLITKDKNGKSIKATAKKEDLAVILVRMMYKETTAKKEYKPGAFTDESKITEYKRPHVTYMKQLGLVKGDANGAFGAGAPVTRALAAKMTTDVMQIINKEETNKPSTDTAMKTVKINKMVDKSDTERYILLEFEDGKTSFYNAKVDVEVLASTGTKMSIDDVAVGATAKVKLEKIGGSDYITKMELISNGSGTVTPNPNPTPNPKPEEKPNPTPTPEEKPNNNDSDIRGKVLKSKMETSNEYILVLEETTGNKEIQVDKAAKITRNGQTAEFAELKVGDTIDMQIRSGKVIRVDAQSKEAFIEGTVQSILIAAQPQITVTTKSGTVNLMVPAGADVYDKTARKEISVKDIAIGSQVEIDAESKEVVALTVVGKPGKVSEMGTITYVGSGGKYIDVLVDKDKVTGTANVVKRINIPGDVSIVINGKEQYRNLLKEDMEVLVTYDYSQGMTPQKIEVLR